MKNKIINYDIIDNHMDYRSKDVSKILALKELSDTNYIDYYTLQDNEKIEGVSYYLYNSTVYWDLLLLINERDPLFGLTYDYDYIATKAEDNIERYNSSYNIDLSVEDPEYYQELIDTEIERLSLINEENRTIKIIKPSKILDFTRILSTLDY